MPHIFLNFHTHRPTTSSTEIVIRNYIFPQEQPEPPHCGQPFSIGIHPWYLPHDIETLWNKLDRLAALPDCIAIGETGIDKYVDASVACQTALFLRQVELAATHHLPLVIHCVKAWNELIALKKEWTTDIPCIIHGFRGKPQLAEKLLEQGFYLSFGFRFNPQSIQLCPADRLFLETDEDPRPVEELYHTAAAIRVCPMENLRTQCLDNLIRLTQHAKK